MNFTEKAGNLAANTKQKPTKPSGRRPGRPTLSNEELLDKALDLFLEQGFERTSIDAITAAAGVAKRTVYLRYGDKETLFRTALQRAIEEWIVPIEQLRAAECDDLEDSLLRVGRILVDNIMSPAGLRLLRITNAESGRMPEISAYNVRHGTEPTLAYLADLFRRRVGKDGAAFPEADEAATAFIHLVVGGPANMAAWGVVLNDPEIDRHLHYSVGLFLRGLLPREQVSPGKGEAAHEALETPDWRELQNENRQLRQLLVASMLEVASLKEDLEGRGTSSPQN